MIGKLIKEVGKAAGSLLAAPLTVPAEALKQAEKEINETLDKK
jgi:hypothetical protein